MQTFGASGGHPATQPMGAPGRGTPRGGGGVRRGRRRDVSFSRLPAFFLLLLLSKIGFLREKQEFFRAKLVKIC